MASEDIEDSENTAMIDASHDGSENKGWDFELKLQDYTKGKYNGNVYNDLLDPMVSDLNFFEAGNKGVLSLLTPENTPSKV